MEDAVLHFFENGYEFIRATTNLSSTEISEDEVAIKDYSENDGVLKFLIENKIVSQPIRFVRSGYVKVPIVKLLV